MQKQKKIEIVQRLIDYYPKDACALNFNNCFELLVAVILSAQCTDKRVNMVTKDLFLVASSAKQMLELGEERLKDYIKSCGFYNAKAKNIISASRDIINKYNGEVPNTREELVSLAGVGEKVASVVLAVWYKVPAIAVDTHVFRLSKRLGLCNEKTPTATMHKLEGILPKDMWRDGHYALVLHGRNFCKAINPNCNECIVREICPKLNLKCKGK